MSTYINMYECMYVWIDGWRLDRVIGLCISELVNSIYLLIIKNIIHTHTYICTVYIRFCHHFKLMWFCCENWWWLCICKLLKQAWFITFYMNLIQFENFILKLNIINHVFVPHVHDIFICMYIINLELCSINCDLICNKGPLLLKRLWPDLWKGTPVKTPFVYIHTVTINSK